MKKIIEFRVLLGDRFGRAGLAKHDECHVGSVGTPIGARCMPALMRSVSFMPGG